MFRQEGFFAIQPKDLHLTLDWLVPYLERFEQETGLIAPQDVIEQAKNTDCQLWSYFDGERMRGVAITRIHTQPSAKICSLYGVVCLDADEIKDGVYNSIEAWARSIGCTEMEICGRPGWIKKFPGFKCKAWLMRKDLRVLS